MAEPKRSTGVRQEAVSLQTTVTELWELILAYARQETVEPLKSLGRYLAFGVAGSVLLAVGAVMLGLGGLRAIQAETDQHLAGNWTWAPYLAVVVYCLAIAGLAVSRIGKTTARGEK